jgi:predicted secreted protein
MLHQQQAPPFFISIQCVDASMTLTEADRGKTIETAAGSVVTLRLGESPTGYRWSVESSGSLSLIDDHLEPGGGAIGAAATRVLSFRATTPGTHDLRLGKRRQWEPDSAAADRFDVRIVVS